MNKPHPVEELSALKSFVDRLEAGEIILRRGDEDVSEHEIRVLKPAIARLETFLAGIKSERKSDKPINYSGRSKRFSRNDK